MKKISTLVLLAAGTISIAAAQSTAKKGSAYNRNQQPTNAIGNDYHQQQGFDKNKTVAYNTSYFSFKEKEAQIQQINRAFDKKINAVKMNRRLRSQEKNKMIRSLENQRRDEIAQVQYRYEKNNQHNVGFKKDKNHKW
jgi:hypothetical protein